jgi:hypothetical protein
LPSRPNCWGRYPSAIKGCWDYFSADVVGAVDIGVDDPLAAGVIPAPVTSATETRFFRTSGIVGREEVSVEEARLTRIALLREEDADPNQFGLVRELFNEPCVRVAVE